MDGHLGSTLTWLLLLVAIRCNQARPAFTSVIGGPFTPNSQSFQPQQQQPTCPLSSAPNYYAKSTNAWKTGAIQKMWNERSAMVKTPLVPLTIPGLQNVQLFFKNETAARTGSVKHRYAWALVMWGLLEDHVNPNSTVYEASSGNTATSEGYMLNMIGVPFVVIVPDTLEKVKEDRITQYGARVIKTYIGKRIERAREEAAKTGGFFMNQFGNADKAEEYHESGDSLYESSNIMREVLIQIRELSNDPNARPDFFVGAAGTGGTLSSVGKYVKKYNIPTQIVLADTEFSIYYDLVKDGRFASANDSGAQFWVDPGMAGFGFGSIGPAIRGETSSLVPEVIDRAIRIPDLASTAAMHFLLEVGVEGGTSTGTNFVGALSLAARESRTNGGKRVKIVTILADSSHYYESSYFNRSWIAQNFDRHGGLPVFDCWRAVINETFHSGDDPLAVGSVRCPSRLQTATGRNSNCVN